MDASARPARSSAYAALAAVPATSSSGARPQEHQLVLRRHELVLGVGELPLRSLRSFPRRLQLLLDLRVGPPLEARGGASRLEESLQALHLRLSSRERLFLLRGLGPHH